MNQRRHTGDKASTRPSERPGVSECLLRTPPPQVCVGWQAPPLCAEPLLERGADPASPARLMALPLCGEAIDDLGSIGQPGCANGCGRGGGVHGRGAGAFPGAGGCGGE